MCSQNKCISAIFLTLFPPSNMSGQEKRELIKNEEAMHQIEANTIKLFIDFVGIKFIPLNCKFKEALIIQSVQRIN